VNNSNRNFKARSTGSCCGDFRRENPSRGNDGFALKKKVAELFEVFDRERSLSIQELMIDNGLPVRMTVADAARA